MVETKKKKKKKKKQKAMGNYSTDQMVWPPVSTFLGGYLQNPLVLKWAQSGIQNVL